MNAKTVELNIFNHIPKCGGSTLTTILSGSLGSPLPTKHDGDAVRVVRRINASGGGRYFVSGHFAWGIHQAVTLPCRWRYLTMLREPLSLFKSFYTYIHKRYATQTDMKDYLDKHYDNNPLCAHLANGDLDLAKARLRDEYAAFGLMEHYDRSLEVFADVFGFPLADYEIENVSHSARVELTPDVVKAFRASNALDLELYGWAEAEFLSRHGAAPRSRHAVVLAGKEKPVRSVSYDRTVNELLKRGKYKDAVSFLTCTGLEKGLEGKTVLSIYYRAGDMEAYKRAAVRQLRLNTISVLSFAYAYSDIDPVVAVRILQAECHGLLGLRTPLPDSSINKYLVECLVRLAELRHTHSIAVDKARKEYQLATSIDPGNPRTLLSFAEHLMSTKEYDKALGVLRNIKRSRANGHVLVRKCSLMGDCHLGKGELKQAQAFYKAAVTVLPEVESVGRYAKISAIVDHRSQAVGIIAQALRAGGREKGVNATNLQLIDILIEVAYGEGYKPAKVDYGLMRRESFPRYARYLVDVVTDVLQGKTTPALEMMKDNFEEFPSETLYLFTWALCVSGVSLHQERCLHFIITFIKLMKLSSGEIGYVNHEYLRAAVGEIAKVAPRKLSVDFLRILTGKVASQEKHEVLLLLARLYLDLGRQDETYEALVAALDLDKTKAFDLMLLAKQQRQLKNLAFSARILTAVDSRMAGSVA